MTPEAAVNKVSPVRKILVTGMSGTGKTTALAELARGFDVVETDEGEWSAWSESEGGCVWREDRVRELLAREDGHSTLYVSGTVSNQGRFYRQFDAVVLLSAPAEVLLRRIADRTTNNYGKSVRERDLILRHLNEVEPLLRATCTHEVDATQPIDTVVEQLVAIGHNASRERA